MASPMLGNAGRVVTARLLSTAAYNHINGLHLPLIYVCCYHGSPYLCKGARSARKLEKMLTKRKKKHYYDPMNVAQLGKLATGFVSGGNKTKMRNDDSIRLRTYNKILYDSINQMMTTSMISDELEQLQLTVLEVRVAGDMSACRVYWKSTGTTNEDERIAEILSRYKSPLRRALISHRVLGKIPPIVFLRDKASASIAEIERLLAIADFGPKVDDDKTEVCNEQEQLKTEGNMEFVRKTSSTWPEGESGSTQPSLFGIDHEAVNRLISAKKNTDTGRVQFDLNDGNLDKRFEHFQAFLKKRKKANRTERKKAILYKGELEFYNSREGTEDSFVGEEMDDVDSYLDVEAYEEQEHNSLSDEPTNK